MVTTDAKSEEKGLCRDKQQIQQWASDKAGKERRLHGVDDPERELRDVEGQHGNQPGYGSLVSHPEAADGIQPQYTHSNGDCTADVKFGWDKPKRSQEENVSGKVPQFLFLPGEAASKDYVHHPLPAEAEAIHKQAKPIQVKSPSLSYSAKAPGSVPAPAAGRRGYAPPGTAGPAHPGTRAHSPD